MILNFQKNSIHISSWRKQYTYAIIVALAILISPFLTFLHLLFHPEHNQINFLGTIVDHGFPSNQVFAWFILANFISLLYLLAIFLFSLGYWRYFLIPVMIHFIAYTFWMFNEDYSSYTSYVFGLPGIIFTGIISSTLLYLDPQMKEKIYRHCFKPTFKQVWKEILYSKNSKLNKQVVNTINNKTRFSLKEYSCRLYFYYAISDFNSEAPNALKNTSSLNRGRVINNLLAVVIIFLTSLLLIHNTIPHGIQEINVFGVEIGCFGFKDFETLIYYASQKFVILSFIVIWFITSQFWWRWAILSPIIIYAYQFWEIFQPVRYIDSSGNLNVFPLVLLTVLGVFLLSKVVRQLSINLDYRKFLEEELDRSIGELSNLKEGGA